MNIMILFLPKFFDEVRCEQLNRIALDYEKRKALSYEGGDYHYANSYGTARIPEYERLLNDLTPIIKAKIGLENIVVENSYTRIYYNGSVLKRHTDRVGLDVTLSVCTFSNITTPWPLHIENNGKIESVETKPGDGALMFGTKYPHWRDQLNADEGCKVIQSFYHWKFA